MDKKQKWEPLPKMVTRNPEKKEDGKIIQYIKVPKSMLEDIPDDGTAAIYAQRAREGR